MALALVTGCATAARREPAVPPLDAEAALFVELRPFPAQARGLKIEIDGLSAVQADGLTVPLTLRHDAVSGAQITGELLLGWGRIEPGAYTALSIKLRRGEAPGPSGQPVKLEAGEIHVDYRFQAEGGRTRVVTLQLRAPAPNAPVAVDFDASEPAKTLPQLTAWCSGAAQHELTVFDKRALEVSEVVPTGRAPWGVALDAVENRAYVALSGDDQIAVFDVQSSAPLARIRLGVGDAPRDLAMTPDRRLLVSANSGSNTISLIDPSSMIEVARVRVGEEPSWLLIDRRGVRAYVFDARSNAIDVVDLNTRSLVSSIATEDRPLRGQFDRSGNRLYVAQPRSAYLTVYSLPDLAVQQRVYVGLGTSAIKVDPATDLVYVARQDDNRLSVYDPFSLIPIAAIDLPDAAAWMVIDDAQNRLLALMPESRSIAVVELTSRRLAGTLDVGSDPRVLSVMGERF